MPPHIVHDFVEQLPWRVRARALGTRGACHPARRPPGPDPHALVEMPDERAAVWMEDVAEDPAPWDLDRYRHAAVLLGRWNARSTDPELLAQCAHTTPNYALRMYAENAVEYRGLMPLADDGLWSHPWLVEHADLRAQLQALAGEIPSMLDRMDSFVLCNPHGDASPQNLLVPPDDPHSFVVIDISFCAPHALGFDLGQLLVGLTHAGLMPAGASPRSRRPSCLRHRGPARGGHPRPGRRCQGRVPHGRDAAQRFRRLPARAARGFGRRPAPCIRRADRLARALVELYRSR